mgnify:FL=1
MLEESTLEYTVKEAVKVTESPPRPGNFHRFKYKAQTAAATVESPDGPAADQLELPCRWEIKSGELQFGEQLGAGACGTVWKGTWKGGPVAIKRLHRQDEAAVSMFFKEVKIMWYALTTIFRFPPVSTFHRPPSPR